MRSARRAVASDRAIPAQPASRAPIRLSAGASVPEDVVKLSRIEKGIRPRLQIRQWRRPDLHHHALGNWAETLSKQVKQKIRSSFGPCLSG